MPTTPPDDITSTVRRALSEDIGPGDLTAKLIPAENLSEATIIVRTNAILCGIDWFDEVFRQLDGTVEIDWQYADGSEIKPGQILCTLHGSSRVLLSGERTALNFLQLLSATATATHHYVALLAGSHAQLLDTRKTLPGLRTSQKYAVACGGGRNHRMGLYDAILIKENHISAMGGINEAVKLAKTLHRNVEVEVETSEELQTAINAGANTILLDNFSIEAIREAVTMNSDQTRLEVSGGVTTDNIRAIAATGVDYISVGSLTKDVRAIDFSMRITAGNRI